jgi:type I restriction enzyme S subunit
LSASCGSGDDAILSDIAEIAALDAKLAKARLLKQGMMQELLTGRIRLA